MAYQLTTRVTLLGSTRSLTLATLKKKKQEKKCLSVYCIRWMAYMPKAALIYKTKHIEQTLRFIFANVCTPNMHTHS